MLEVKYFAMYGKSIIMKFFIILNSCVDMSNKYIEETIYDMTDLKPNYLAMWSLYKDNIKIKNVDEELT